MWAIKKYSIFSETLRRIRTKSRDSSRRLKLKNSSLTPAQAKRIRTASSTMQPLQPRSIAQEFSIVIASRPHRYRQQRLIDLSLQPYQYPTPPLESRKRRKLRTIKCMEVEQQIQPQPAGFSVSAQQVSIQRFSQMTINQQEAGVKAGRLEREERAKATLTIESQDKGESRESNLSLDEIQIREVGEGTLSRAQIGAVVEARTNLLSRLGSFVISSRKLMKTVYPQWIDSAWLIYQKFVYQRKLLADAVLQRRRFQAYFGVRTDPRAFQQFRSEKGTELREMAEQNDQAEISLARMRTRVKDSKLLAEAKSDKLTSQYLWSKMVKEVNVLKEHGNPAVINYLCQKVGCVLILRELDGGPRCKEDPASPEATRAALTQRLAQIAKEFYNE